MATPEDLQAYLDKLRKVRASGVRDVEYHGNRVSYRTDDELAAAILDVERQLAGSSGRRASSVVFATTKGV